MVNEICNILDRVKPRKSSSSYRDLITFIEDRPGHDFRYAIDASKIINELDWTPSKTFSTGLEKTIKWYIKNEGWLDKLNI